MILTIKRWNDKTIEGKTINLEVYKDETKLDSKRWKDVNLETDRFIVSSFYIYIV